MDQAITQLSLQLDMSHSVPQLMADVRSAVITSVMVLQETRYSTTSFQGIEPSVVHGSTALRQRLKNFTSGTT
jgi:hypothetical protein